ncbi:MAG: LUD domain-containing protein [Intrasporangiaceae bacterium]|nr:LUD domain-containing protein [Intrasporangiaceae bacterium]
MSARDEVLRRVRDALGPDAVAPEAPRTYATTGSLTAAERVDLLVDRLVDYRAAVVDARDGGVAAALRSVLPQGQVLHAPGLPQDWLPGGTEPDDGTPGPRELDTIAGVVTGSVTAIALTGTIVLDGSPLCGRRSLSLVPDLHVCIVRTQDIVETVPEGLARLEPTRPLTLISGPSATSDIELNRVEGVHGPRTLIVVLV